MAPESLPSGATIRVLHEYDQRVGSESAVIIGDLHKRVVRTGTLKGQTDSIGGRKWKHAVGALGRIDREPIIEVGLGPGRGIRSESPSESQVIRADIRSTRCISRLDAHALDCHSAARQLDGFRVVEHHGWIGI